MSLNVGFSRKVYWEFSYCVGKKTKIYFSGSSTCNEDPNVEVTRNPEPSRRDGCGTLIPGDLFWPTFFYPVFGPSHEFFSNPICECVDLKGNVRVEKKKKRTKTNRAIVSLGFG